MRLCELIETPIAGYTTLSDKPTSPVGEPAEISTDPTEFDKRSSSYTDKRDRRLLTNPVAVERMKSLFQKTSEDFYFYVVNSKEARHHTEVGHVKRGWLEKNMPAIAPHIEDHPDGITVIYTNNKGDQKIPMTPWIMAHRLAHSFARRPDGKHLVSEYKSASDAIDSVTDNILEYHYGVRHPNKNRLARKKFFQEIGTFRSARKGILREDFEFLNEVFAQYLITGAIRFNRPPEKMVLSKAWGNDSEVYYLRNEQQDAVNMLDMLQNDLEYYIENMLSQAIGSIFLM